MCSTIILVQKTFLEPSVCVQARVHDDGLKLKINKKIKKSETPTMKGPVGLESVMITLIETLLETIDTWLLPPQRFWIPILEYIVIQCDKDGSIRFFLLTIVEISLQCKRGTAMYSNINLLTSVEISLQCKRGTAMYSNSNRSS